MSNVLARRINADISYFRDPKAHLFTVVVKAISSGLFTCTACLRNYCQSKQEPFFLTTLREALEVSLPMDVMEGDDVEIECKASKYNHSSEDFTWYQQTKDG